MIDDPKLSDLERLQYAVDAAKPFVEDGKVHIRHGGTVFELHPITVGIIFDSWVEVYRKLLIEGRK